MPRYLQVTDLGIQLLNKVMLALGYNEYGTLWFEVFQQLFELVAVTSGSDWGYMVLFEVLYQCFAI